MRKLAQSYQHKEYTVRKKVFKIFGAAFDIYGPNGDLVFFSKQKAFKLKEDIRVYSNKEMTQELMLIKARQILDFSAVYDVMDSQTNEKVGVLKRKGMKSLIKDEWIIMDSSEREIGTVKEDKLFLALLRRALTNLIPQSFIGDVNDQQVFKFKQNFNPIAPKLYLDFTLDVNDSLDRRLGIAAAILLVAIEGRQN